MKPHEEKRKDKTYFLANYYSVKLSVYFGTRGIFKHGFGSKLVTGSIQLGEYR